MVQGLAIWFMVCYYGLRVRTLDHGMALALEVIEWHHGSKHGSGYGTMVRGMAIYSKVWHNGSWFITLVHSMALQFMVLHYGSWYCTMAHGIALWLMVFADSGIVI